MYLNKKAVLEWLDREKEEDSREWEVERVSAYLNVIEEIQSGTFDADTSEIQRLREALKMTKSELRWGDPTNAIERIERIIDEALSTATESTGQKDTDDLIGDRIDEKCPKCGADMLANKVGDKWCSLVGCDYSINAPEGDQP